jgi:O-antigen/teichoic acid export membrane protein
MSTHKRNRRIILASSVGASQRLVQVASTLVVVPFVLRALGPAKFGIWGAASSLAWLTGILDIGTGYALLTMVAGCLACDRVDEARTHIAGALTIGSLLSLPMMLVAAIACLGGALQGHYAPYVIALAGLALNLPVNPANSVWMSLQEGYFSSLWELVQTLLSTAGLLTATAFTTDVRVYVTVVYGAVALSNLGSLIHLYLRHPELRPEKLPVPVQSMKTVASSGAMFFVMITIGSLSYLLDNVLALQLLGPEASARMTIAIRICVTAIGLLVVVSQPLWPAFTDAVHRTDRHWIFHNFVRGTALLSAAATFGATVFVLYGESLLRLWLHVNLGIDRKLVWAVAVWIVAATLIRVPFLLLNAVSLIRFQVVVYSLSTLTAFALKFALAEKMGVAGILWASSFAALLVVLPMSLWRIWHWAKHLEPVNESALAKIS